MKFFVRIIIIFLFFIFVSCLSSPEPKYENASQKRDKIIKYNLKKYIADELKEVEKDFTEAKKLLDNKKNVQADKLLDDINTRYQALLDKAFPLCVDDKDEESKIVQTSCLELKANVAVKDKYDEAYALYNEALGYKEAKEYEKAVDLLDKANGLFEKVKEITIEKKEKAENSFDTTANELLEFESSIEEFENKIIQIKKELDDELNEEGSK